MAQGYTKGVPIDTDVNLTLNSDLLVPSQKAVKAYTTTAANNVYRPVTITVALNGSGTTLVTGVLAGADIKIPFAMTITEWHLLANASGSLVVDIWKDTYANFPPTVADTICSTDKPTLSSAQKNQNTAISAWGSGASIAAGSILRFNIDSCTTITYATLSLVGTRV